jgi:hypothetical protein
VKNLLASQPATHFVGWGGEMVKSAKKLALLIFVDFVKIK